jgi:hypothetical protein
MVKECLEEHQMGDFMMITDTKCPLNQNLYDGGEDWEEYISHFEICAELGKWCESSSISSSIEGPCKNVLH